MQTDTPHSASSDGVRYRVGIDGGGTGTRARLVDAQGRVLGEGRAGPSNLTQGIAQAWRHVAEAVQKAMHQAIQQARMPTEVTLANTVLGLGLAGANLPTLKQEFLQANPGYRVAGLENDGYATLLGAHGTAAGAIITVGTGSIGLARLGDGQRRTVGGWGFPSGDDGSGALLGLRAVNHTQHVLDGLQAGGPLADAVVEATGGERMAMLGWCVQATATEFASLAPLVFAHAADDPQAAALLAYALQCIERMARALDPSQSLPLALLGGIGRMLAPQLCASLQSRMVRPQGDAMDGALQLCAP